MAHWEHAHMTGILAVALVASGGAVVWFAHRLAAPPRPRIVCFGNSLTACGGLGGRYSDYLQEELPAYEVLNLGVSGDTLTGGLARFQRDVLDLHPVAVVIELGANDFHQNVRSVAELRGDLESMVRAARARGIAVVVAGVFGDQLDIAGQVIPKQYPEGDPARGRAILEMERGLAAAYGCFHVENIQADLNQPEHWGDARHPGPAGNVLVARRILPALRQALAAAAGASVPL